MENAFNQKKIPSHPQILAANFGIGRNKSAFNALKDGFSTMLERAFLSLMTVHTMEQLGSA
jgi:hypothetical protein